ncbi:hypothetical protein V8C86DRAFT_3129734 [Haematococcus lacustris]
MFKKHMPALGVEGKVSGADRKKLRRALEKLFVQLTEDSLEPPAVARSSPQHQAVPAPRQPLAPAPPPAPPLATLMAAGSGSVQHLGGGGGSWAEVLTALSAAAQALAVLPSKAGDLVMVKLAAPRREDEDEDEDEACGVSGCQVLYRLDGCPLFIDISGKMELVPTVFALWRLHVKHSAVSQFLVGGADLMLPGGGEQQGATMGDTRGCRGGAAEGGWGGVTVAAGVLSLLPAVVGVELG